MNRGLVLWLGGTLAAAILIVLALVPPHDILDRWHWERLIHPSERAKVRADTHLDETRRVLFALETADSLIARSGRRPPGSITLLAHPRVPREIRERFDSLLVRARTRGAGLEGAPVVVALLYRESHPWSNWFILSRAAEYLLPAAAGRDACIALVDVTPAARNFELLGRAEALRALDVQLDRWRTPHLLGPCGFVGTFGTPGDSIRAWLDDWSWSMARSPQWLFEREPRPLDDRLPAHFLTGMDLKTVHREAQADTPDLYGCAAGNPQACLAAVSAGVDDRTRRLLTAGLKHEVLVSRQWWLRSSLGPGSDVYLSDMVADLGAERFGRFWGSDQSVEAAFEAAFETTLSAWTMKWARNYLGEPPAGPRVRLASVLLGLAVMGLAVGGSALWVRVRQVA